MNIIDTLLTVIAIVAMAIGVILFMKGKQVSKYEYLDSISYTEWKRGYDIVKEINELKGSRITFGEFYINMSELTEEGLIERRLSEDGDGPVAEYRRLPGNTRTNEHVDTPSQATTRTQST